MENKTSSMTYNEAVKYLENNLNIFNQVDMDSRCDYDSPFNISNDYARAHKIVNEHNIQEFLNIKFKKK